uniref:FYVE-type domain-containing protein n=1 Tax=Palpitomonas bilix TaxID=652834 RepID=A0A7S3D373_9EUKA|mmetsp:Transcript_18273/g.45700  ORF Transcript_18273/g.45700 Transcript_18273/m.45700 type:complete len:538 (+) Transcript_18273:186-1799(+)|eukprot:CAMPEP_0113879418 /NCGR_PEP_ID=MMETSP0780_2-20120614/7229_1 /TAXON_ID=652834 /ORGANISM="Palpitomonas bilix" /LENGTH=537 /DNA_ID=CAMNT_0000866001 /DNA_START=183 /DNA_END=1796 /DNA_ORIENTATION=- /assembly_acc=CAM_ASM_000599
MAAKDYDEFAPEWVEDFTRTECIECKRAFSTLRRKHHCRRCGDIFCSKCSSKKLVLPWVAEAGEVRVCDACFAKPLPQPRFVQAKKSSSSVIGRFLNFSPSSSTFSSPHTSMATPSAEEKKKIDEEDIAEIGASAASLFSSLSPTHGEEQSRKEEKEKEKEKKEEYDRNRPTTLRQLVDLLQDESRQLISNVDLPSEDSDDKHAVRMEETRAALKLADSMIGLRRRCAIRDRRIAFKAFKKVVSVNVIIKRRFLGANLTRAVAVWKNALNERLLLKEKLRECLNKWRLGTLSKMLSHWKVFVLRSHLNIVFRGTPAYIFKCAEWKPVQVTEMGKPVHDQKNKLSMFAPKKYGDEPALVFIHVDIRTGHFWFSLAKDRKKGEDSEPSSARSSFESNRSYSLAAFSSPAMRKIREGEITGMKVPGDQLGPKRELVSLSDQLSIDVLTNLTLNQTGSHTMTKQTWNLAVPFGFKMIIGAPQQAPTEQYTKAAMEYIRKVQLHLGMDNSATPYTELEVAPVATTHYLAWVKSVQKMLKKRK